MIVSRAALLTSSSLNARPAPRQPPRARRPPKKHTTTAAVGKSDSLGAFPLAPSDSPGSAGHRHRHDLAADISDGGVAAPQVERVEVEWQRIGCTYRIGGRTKVVLRDIWGKAVPGEMQVR